MTMPNDGPVDKANDYRDLQAAEGVEGAELDAKDIAINTLPVEGLKPNLPPPMRPSPARSVLEAILNAIVPKEKPTNTDPFGSGDSELMRASENAYTEALFKAIETFAAKDTITSNVFAVDKGGITVAPREIAGRNLDRLRIHITNRSDTDTVYISPTRETCSPDIAYPILKGETLTLETISEIWACADATKTPSVSILTEVRAH